MSITNYPCDYYCYLNVTSFSRSYENNVLTVKLKMELSRELATLAQPFFPTLTLLLNDTSNADIFAVADNYSYIIIGGTSTFTFTNPPSSIVTGPVNGFVENGYPTKFTGNNPTDYVRTSRVTAQFTYIPFPITIGSD